jgi:signal transduction histidine kinase
LRVVAHTLAIIVRHYEIESEKERLREQLAVSEKYAALGRISANVADEIRNPLTAVGGFARRLHKRAADRTKEREYADFIMSEVNRLEMILKDTLEYSKSLGLELKPEFLHEIVDDVLKTHEEIFRSRSIKVERSYGCTSEILIDTRRAREVIMNVISNAIDAMPGGGTIAAGTSTEEIEGRSLYRDKNQRHRRGHAGR